MAETNVATTAVVEQQQEQDTHPSHPHQRVMKWTDFTWLWIGMTTQMGILAFGASLAGRISFWEAVAAVIIGNTVVGILCVLNGDIGIEHGINYSVFLRAPYGLKGAVIPSVLRGITAVSWFGIQTFFGSTAIDMGVKFLTGYSNWWLFYILFGLLQIFLTIKGIGLIKILENIASPLLGLLSFWLIYAYMQGQPWSAFTSVPITKPISFWAVVVANLSYWITVADNIPDFTRFIVTKQGEKSFWKRNMHSIIGQIPGLTVGMLLFVTVGMVGAAMTGFDNPVEAIGQISGGSGGMLLVAIAVVLIAQLAANVAANLFASGYIISGITHNKMTFAGGVILAGFLGLTFTMPWKLIDAFLVFLPIIGAALSPVAGMMVADYYLIRRRMLKVSDLYTENSGQYMYWNGYNPAALIAHVVGTILGIVYLEYSWLVSVPVTIALYTALMKLWIAKVYPQEEVALSDVDASYLGTTAGTVYTPGVAGE